MDKATETIVLNATIETLDRMLNKEILVLCSSNDHQEVKFKNNTHQYYFEINLVDFIAPFDKEVILGKKTTIDLLYEICQNPNFSTTSKIIDTLRKSIDNFASWLSGTALITNIDLPLDITEIDINREDIVKICGNKSKHHIGRLGSIIKKIDRIYRRKSISVVDDNQLFQALEKIYERIQEDILPYHLSYVSEMLNDIRWGIQTYLTNEYMNSYTKDANDKYRYFYKIPLDINTNIGKYYYWDLMNKVGSKPFLEPFRSSKIFSKKY